MKVLGWLLVFIGILVGLYVGLWVMFIGGIIQIVDAVQMDPVPGDDIAWGIVRILLAGVVGWACALAIIIPGLAIADSD